MARASSAGVHRGEDEGSKQVPGSTDLQRLLEGASEVWFPQLLAVLRKVAQPVEELLGAVSQQQKLGGDRVQRVCHIEPCPCKVRAVAVSSRRVLVLFPVTRPALQS